MEGVRRPCTREKGGRQPAGVLARKVSGRTMTGRESCVRPLSGPRHLRQYPIEQDVRGRDAHVCVQHTRATAHSVAGWRAVKTVSYRFNVPDRGRGRGELRRRRGALQRVHPVIMTTPGFDMRTGARRRTGLC
jgi:hypothetical protein